MTANKPTVWFVATEVPSLRGGAPVRNYNLIKQYSRLGYQVRVFCLDDQPASDDIARLGRIKQVQVTAVGLPHLSPWRTLTAVAVQRILPFMAQFRRSKLRHAMRATLKASGAPDILQLEQSKAYHAVEPVLAAFQRAGSTIVLDCHNVEQAELRGSLLLMNPARRLAGRWVLPNYARIENRAARQADVVLACSETDRKFFAALGCPRTAVVANGVDITRFAVSPASTEHALLFMGGTSYAPNEDALKWYLRDIHPLVKQAVPDMRLYILGGEPPDWLCAAAEQDDNLKPMGFVDDVRKYLHRAKVCISPVRHGSGTSLKVLEYLASAKAVVSTTVGARGIACTHSKDILLADDAGAFADSVVRALKGDALSRKLSAAGRKLIEHTYDWTKIGDTMHSAVSQPARPAKKPTPATNPIRIRLSAEQALGLTLCAIALANLMIGLEHLPVLLRGAIVLPALTLLPGLLILAAAHARLRSMTVRLLYACGLSMAYLMLGGFVYNNGALALGIARPLDRVPVWVFMNASLLGLTAVMYVRCYGMRFVLQRHPTNSLSLALAGLSIGGVLLLVGGANTLNNGGANYLTMGALALVATCMSLCYFLAKRLNGWVFPVVLYCSGLGLLLMYSLRSGHVLGWDVNLEHQVFRITQSAGNWRMANAPGEEYNACLSITLLPTILHQLIGGATESIFRVSMQVLFALVPVGVFALGKRYVKVPLAFVAGGVYLCQTWFIEQLPALVRQEIAFIFLILTMLVVLDHAVSKRLRYGMALVFSAGIAVSHYSTAYVWVIMAVLACLALVVLRLLFSFIDLRRHAIFAVVAVASFGIGVLWSTFYTKTSSNTQGFMQNFATHANDVFTVETLRGGIERIGFSGDTANNAAELQANYDRILQSYAPGAGANYRLYADSSNYTPEPSSHSQDAEGVLPTAFSEPLLLAAKVVKLLALNVFPILGIIYTIVTIRSMRNKGPDVADYVALCAATLPLIGMVLFLPFIQASYNLTRLFMQIFMVLSLQAVIGSFTAFKLFKAIPRARHTGAAAVSALWLLFFLYSTGFVHQLAGGPMHVSTSAAAQQHDSFYTYDSEIAAAQWLSRLPTSDHDQPLVYADIVASLRLKGHSNIKQVNTDVFPTTIDQSGYVYLSRTNTQQNLAHLFFNSEILTYTYPASFLDNHKNRVYSNGASTIYR